MVENQIRGVMKDKETTYFLPVAKELLSKSGIVEEELKEYPVEGYYYNTPELKLYQKIIRNIQHNNEVYSRIKSCEELEILRNLCDNDIFGIKDPLKRENNSPLHRKHDILTLVMEDEKYFDHSLKRPWTIPKIMESIGNWADNRVNLTELAYLTGDPLCLCCSAETNCNYRMVAWISGSCSSSYHLGDIMYVWEVSDAVEELGKRIINEYTKLLNANTLKIPTLGNHIYLSKTTNTPRVSLLGYVDFTKEYYHWIADENDLVRDEYNKNVITTESYINKSLSPHFKGNFFNSISS